MVAIEVDKLNIWRKLEATIFKFKGDSNQSLGYN
jgi:hypothetical protein